MKLERWITEDIVSHSLCLGLHSKDTNNSKPGILSTLYMLTLQPYQVENLIISLLQVGKLSFGKF